MSSSSNNKTPASLIAADDVAQVIRLLGDLIVSNEPLPARRNALLEGLARIIDADVWLWARSRVDENNQPAMWEMLDGGHASEAERSRFMSALNDSSYSEFCLPQLRSSPLTTCTIDQLYPPTDPEAGPIYRKWVKATQLPDMLASLYSLQPGVFSAIVLYRRPGRPQHFGDRERALVHLVCGQISWLHRSEADVPGNSPLLLDLTPREREVLLYLLSGDARKAIARKMGLSPHTVAGHVKRIYRQFGVNGQTALLSLFVTGRANASLEKGT
ncbi:MAG: helix-turn-helix transcriptional regulator [Tepidisphaeraceae bacterium]